MLLAVVIALFATLVAGAFAAALGRQWQQRRRHHALAWAASLCCFAGGTAAIALGVWFGWNTATFGTYWWTGALMTVPLLAVGQLHLLVPRLAALWWTVAALYGVWAVFTLLASPSDGLVLASADLDGSLPRGAEVFGPDALTMRLLRFSNAISVVPILGSIWSGWRSRRWGVLLIGVGAAIAGASFGAVRLVDGASQSALAAGLLAVGVVAMYAGFLSAGQPSRRPAVARRS